MKSPKWTIKLAVSGSLLLAAVAAPTASFAAGPGGLALGFGNTVARMMSGERYAMPFAGVSDPVSLRSIDNINTHGFALRRDGAY
jgi:hypothetical protein